MSASIVFHLLAALAYGTLAFMLWRPVTQGDAQASISKAGRAGVLAAIVLHGIALRLAILQPGSLHLGWALALSAAICLGLIVFWLDSLLMRIDGLLLILLPAATVATVLAAISPGEHLVPHANNDWLQVHLIIALMAYGLITIAALHAILMTLLDRQLHRPVQPEQQRTLLNRALDSMPPLLVQEKLLFRLIWVGFSVLTLTIATGTVVSLRFDGTFLPFDHKTVFTLLSWLTFGGLLIGRHARGWIGRLALRWTHAGFAFHLLSYTGSRFVLDVILQRGYLG